MIFFSIPCYGFINRISGFAYRLQERIINRYILYDSMKSFEYMSHAIVLYLNDYSDLVSEFVADNNWYDKLKRDKVITDAYVRSKKQRFTIGNVFLPQIYERNRFYIGNDNLIHYFYTEKSGTLLSDTIIDKQFLLNAFENLKWLPSWIIIYDEGEQTYTIVFSEREILSFGIDINKIVEGEARQLIGIKAVRYVKKLDLIDSNLFLVAQYPIRLGVRAYLLFGLIVLVIITILLLLQIILFILSNIRKYEFMQFDLKKEATGSGVVDEIELELSSSQSLKNELKKDTKEEEVREDGIERGTVESFKSDGIRIKKS